MRYYLFVSIAHFYMRAHAEQNSLLIIHKDKTVLDVSSSAQSRGIAVGISLAEAKAILGGEGTYLAWKEEEYASFKPSGWTFAPRLPASSSLSSSTRHGSIFPPKPTLITSPAN